MVDPKHARLIAVTIMEFDMGVVKLGVLISVGAIAAAAAALALTNPDQAAYEAYAAERLSQQLETSLCPQVPVFFEGLCASVLEGQDAWLEEIVADQTTRRNYGLFSIYETDLAAESALEQVLPAELSLDVDGLPVYHVETVGLFNQFFTYQFQQVRS
ncbi:MAG: DUF4359 domain-containing protein [Cyanobacteria bacterium P01_A01_bin.135]